MVVGGRIVGRCVAAGGRIVGRCVAAGGRMVGRCMVGRCVVARGRSKGAGLLLGVLLFPPNPCVAAASMGPKPGPNTFLKW